MGLFFRNSGEKVVEDISKSLEFYKGVLNSCRNYVLESARRYPAMRCPKCGYVFAGTGEGPGECPRCRTTPVLRASDDDVRDYVSRYCSGLYGRTIEYIETLLAVARRLCRGRYECAYTSSVIELDVGAEKYSRYLRTRLHGDQEKGYIEIVVRGLDEEVLKIVEEVSSTILERSSVLREAGIRFAVFRVDYEGLRISYSKALEHGFLDSQYYKSYLDSQGYGLTAMPGLLVRVLDLEKKGIAVPPPS